MRLDAWLCDECPQYETTSKSHRDIELEKMLKAAKMADMVVEADYAVFCRLLIGAVFEPNIDFSAPSEDLTVKKIMLQGMSAGDKLLTLENFFNEMELERG